VRIVGLTGGIASGKSTVARLLAERGVPVVDADALAREVVAPGTPALAAIAARWPSVVRGGALDRKALGAIVFADPVEREALEAIVHPAIAAEADRRLAALEAAGASIAVYEAALLVERGLDQGLDALVVVALPAEEQVRRLVARDGIAEAEARARVEAQAPLAEKLRRADYVIDNTGSLEDLRARVDELWSRVEREGPRGTR
jgi:dephospho-CoA kinase